MRRVAFVFLVVLASSARAQFQGHARAWLGPGVDTNAKREFVSYDVIPVADGFVFGLAQLDGTAQFFDRLRLAGSYDVAARKFIAFPTEDTVVQSAQLEATVQFMGVFAAGVSGRARDRRGAERDYTDLVGGAVLDFFPTAAIDVRAQLQAHRFLFYNRFAYSFWGPDGSLNARYRFDRRHSVSLSGTYNARTYNANARTHPDEMGQVTDSGVTRFDPVFSGAISYSYRGPFHLTASYAYVDQTSNSYGETVKRHRLSLTAGVRLPWKITALGSITWQPSLFPDGVYLSPDLTVTEDDENMSSLTLKLVRPLNAWIDLDVRYAGYLGIYPQNNFLYLRHVVSAGLAVSF